MRWRARVIAPILAVVLGTTGGVATALLTQTGGPVTPADDPLGLGVPLHDLACDGSESILIVGYGNSGAQLGNGISDNKAAHPQYLQTADSCHTQLGPERALTPEYVAYLGPYTSKQEPCELRMTAAHRTDFVARLAEGNTELVKCPCEVKTEIAPELTSDMLPTDDQFVWIRSLQGMLHDYDLKIENGVGFTHKDITGKFDPFTQQYILKKFQVPAGYLSHFGDVDTETWRIILNKVCALYDY